MTPKPVFLLLTTSKPYELKDQLVVRRHSRRVMFDANGSRAAEKLGIERVGLNPLSGISTADDALRLADITMRSVSTNGLSDGDFWVTKAIALSWPYLLRGAMLGQSMPAVVREVSRGSLQELQGLHDFFVKQSNDHGRSAVEEFLNMDERTRSSVAATAAAGFLPFADGANGCLDGLPPLDVRQAILDGDTVIVHAEDRTAAHTKAIYIALLDQVINACGTLAAEGRNPRARLLLDEMGTAVPHPKIAQISAMAPGNGVELYLAFQAPEQRQRLLGVGGLELDNNTATRVILPGTTSRDLRSFVGSLLPPVVVRDGDQVVGVIPSAPIDPPPTGSVVIVDEHARVIRARQIVPHRDPDFTWNRIAHAALDAPMFRSIVREHRQLNFSGASIR